MDTPEPVPGADPAASPTAPSFADYEREANARDLTPSTPSPTTPPADPSPAGDAPQTARADSPAAPPPDKKPKTIKDRGPQLDKEITDLQAKLALRRALREELATFDRGQPAKPASDPAPATPTTAEWERYRRHPDAPKVDAFESYEDFVAAQAVFVADRRFEERAQRERLEAESRERMTETQRTITGFHERLASAREADPDFDAKVDPGLLTLTPRFALKPGEPVGPANVLLEEVIASEASPRLLAYFSTPEGHQEWQRLTAAPTAAAMLKLFGRVEARFLSDGSPAAAPAPAKPVTSAPDPPMTLGVKPPQSPDRAAAALKAGDFRAYQAAADAADLAAHRR